MKFGMKVVFGLAVAASSAFTQFSQVSSREAINANDMVTWNQLGPAPARLPLPQTATSLLGVQVTVDSELDTKIFLSTAGSYIGVPPEFGANDVILAMGSNKSVSLSFNPPVLAVGMNTWTRPDTSPRWAPAQLENVKVIAYRGAAELGRVALQGGPFAGVQDPGGITKIVFDMEGCTSPNCGGATFNQLSLVSPQRVSVSVKPGADKSVIVAHSNAKLPVAILSTPGFNASTAVDTASLRFGRTGDESSVESCSVGVDVNYDSLPDLLCQFAVAKSGFQSGDLTAKLKGKLLGNGAPIYGSADVIVK